TRSRKVSYDLVGEELGQVNLQRPARNAVLQRCAIQKLHGDERLVILLANFVDSADIGMVEGRSSPSLAAEAFQRLRVLHDILGEEFERHKSAKRGVLRLISA